MAATNVWEVPVGEEFAILERPELGKLKRVGMDGSWAKVVALDPKVQAEQVARFDEGASFFVISACTKVTSQR